MRVGIAVRCNLCGRNKAPFWRSIGYGLYLCERDCPGYYQDPRPGSLWPGETEKEFGYPIISAGTKEVPDREIDVVRGALPTSA